MSIVLASATVASSSRDWTAFDGYLNNQGVIYYEGEGMRATTSSLQLRPVRSDVGNNAYETRPESGDIFSQGDFSYGMGQQFFHRPNRNAAMYYLSDGLDISEPGKLTHLYATAEAHDSANAGSMFIVNDTPFVTDGTTVRRGNGAFPGTWTSETVAAATINDATAMGDEAFAVVESTTEPIWKRSTGGTWAVYQTSTPTTITLGGNTGKKVLAWRGRLIVTTARNIYEVTGSVATPSSLNTLPVGWEYTALWTNGEYIYAAAVNANAGLSEIWHFGLNSAATAVEAKGSTPMPIGQLAYSGTGYLSTVFVGVGKRNSSGGYDPVLYQAIPSEAGYLQLVKVAEEEGAGTSDLSVRAIKPTGEAVLFGWSLTSSSTTGQAREGLGIYHLGRASFAHHIKKNTAAGTPARIRDIMVYKGRILFTVNGDGLYYENIGTYVPQAYLVSSIADWNNAGVKDWSNYEIATKPLPTSATVQMQYSLQHPDENVWTTADTHTIPGSEGETVTLSGVESRTFAVKLVSNSTTDQLNAPEIISFSVRSDPKPNTSEWNLTRYVRVGKKDQKDKRGRQILQDPLALRNAIQNLLYDRITLYEPEATWNVRVESVADVEPAQAVHPHAGANNDRSFWIVELRMVGTKTA